MRPLCVSVAMSAVMFPLAFTAFEAGAQMNEPGEVASCSSPLAADAVESAVGDKQKDAVVNIVFASVWNTDLAKAVGLMKMLARKANVNVWLLYHLDVAGGGPKSKDLREAGVNLLQFTGDTTLWKNQQSTGMDGGARAWLHTTSFSDFATVPLYLAKSVKKALGPPIPPKVFEMSAEMKNWTDKQVDKVIGKVDFWISDEASPYALYASRKFSPTTTAMGVWWGNDSVFRFHPGQDNFSTGVLFLWFGGEIIKGTEDYVHFVPTLTANWHGHLGDLRRDETLSAKRFGGGSFQFPRYPQNLPALPDESIRPVPDVAQNTTCVPAACMEMELDWNVVRRKSDCCSFRELAFCASGHRYAAGKAGCGDSSGSNPHVAAKYAASGFHQHSTCCVRDARYPVGSAGDPGRQPLLEARAPRIVPYQYAPGAAAVSASTRDGAEGSCQDDEWIRDVAGKADGRTLVYVSWKSRGFEVSWENLEYMVADLRRLPADEFYVVFRLNFLEGSFSEDRKRALERRHPNFRIEPSVVSQPALFSCLHNLVFISHCGMGSVLEALAAGHPIVATPIVHDQPDTARTLAQLGLAFDASPFHGEMLSGAALENRLSQGVLHWSSEESVRSYAESRRMLRNHLEQHAFDDKRLVHLVLHIARTKMNWKKALQLDSAG